MSFVFESEQLNIQIQLDKVKTELDEAKKRLQSEKTRYKQSSEDLKKRNKELMVRNDELCKELQEVKNLNLTEKKFDGLAGTSKFQPTDIDGKAKLELDGLRNQRKFDQSTIQKLKRELKNANEKIVDLENVLEAHQAEIEEHKNELKTAANEKKQSKEVKPNKKKNKDTEDLIKVLDLLTAVKKNANNLSNQINATNNNEKRAQFDEQVGKLKNKNNILIESITVVKLTTRSFEAVEKELARVRAENNQIIKSVRKQAQDAVVKINTLYDQFTKNYPQSLKLSTEQYTKELEELIKTNLDSLYKNEEVLEEDIIKKLLNEKEFLNTVLSKQDVM